VKQESSNGTVLNDEKFTYDVFNNRIAVSLNGTPQLYTVYDGANPYLDFNGSGQLTERYLYNPNALSQFYGQVSASGNVQWFLTDNIHSIRQVVSASGSVLDLITYDPYGNILSQTNAANAPRFLYAGGAYDSLTGYNQFGRHYYDPSDGRWTSQDPLGFKAGDTDLYRYVFNAPTNETDPSGQLIPIIPILVWGGIMAVSAAVGYAVGVSVTVNPNHPFESLFTIIKSVARDSILGLAGSVGIGAGLEGIKHIPVPKETVAPGQRVGTTLGNRIQVRYGGKFWGTKNISLGTTISRIGKVASVITLYELAWSIYQAAESERLADLERVRQELNQTGVEDEPAN
jgi:RHS repeat-associated protein